MSSFHQTLSFHSFEAAVNGVARLARTQGFRIHQRKSPQKNNYELQGLASFGCTAPGCGWFITLRRLALDGPSTSTAPAEQWIVYTLFDSHKSTCKPARSRRRRPSISSITSLETEITEDEIPPELLRPYERSPSLPILMHARGSRPGHVNGTTGPSSSQALPTAPQSTINGHAGPEQSEPPDPVELSNYIQELLASLETQAAHPDKTDNTAAAIDPRALLASLNEPLTLPPHFTFPTGEQQQSTPQSDISYAFGSQYPFSDDFLPAGREIQASLSDRVTSELASLPHQFQCAASVVHTIDPQTINPSHLHPPPKTNGYHGSSLSMSTFFDHSANKQDHQSQSTSKNRYEEYAAPVSTDDWSDGEDDGDPDLSQSFLHHSYDAPQDLEAYNAELWQENANGAVNGSMDYNGASQDDNDYQARKGASEDGSSSDSDIPAEALININTSRSNPSNSPYGVSNPLERNQDPGPSHQLDPGDAYQPDYEPYCSVAPIERVAPPISQTQSRPIRQPIFPTQTKAPIHHELDDAFDIYRIFYSFEEAEDAILSTARKSGLPLKIRYRPNLLNDGINARRQACLECLRLCGYRIYLKDDHKSQWRVINMEGGHKPSCYQGKAKSKIRRGTNPFRSHRNKDKDSMHVSIPVVEPVGTKRKRREVSMSSDRSSSPSILVVTHSDAVMRSVRNIGPGFTPPPEYWYPSASPEPVKKSKSKGKGKGKGKKNGRSPDRAIKLGDSADEDTEAPFYGAGSEVDYLPLSLVNNLSHPDLRHAENEPSTASQYARKKLPTTQQLLRGSSRTDIQPRHKIPTKPMGRSPAKNRLRQERRIARIASRNTAHTSPILKGGGPAFGQHAQCLPGDSSANDDDQDMFYHADRFSQRVVSNGQSSRALRSTRQTNGTSSRQEEASSQHHGSSGRLPNPEFLPSASDTLVPTSQTAVRGRGRPRLDPRKGINRNVGLKMTLSQAGFSDQQVRFLQKGGYASVKDIAREGLPCGFADISLFESWLDALVVPPSALQDPQSTRQSIRHRIRTLAEEVKVRSTIIWEAAGMMEEGSDVGEEVGANGTNRTNIATASYSNKSNLHDMTHTLHSEGLEIRPSKPLRHAHTQLHTAQKPHITNHHHTTNRD